MKAEEQRIAIAEWCGWKQSQPGVTGERRWVLKDGDVPSYIGALPDYLNDLNAMHEAEERLDYSEYPHYTLRDRYALNLLRMVATNPKPGFNWGDNCDADFFKVAHATAAQRVEVLLKTIGKWED